LAINTSRVKAKETSSKITAQMSPIYVTSPIGPNFRRSHNWQNSAGSADDAYDGWHFFVSLAFTPEGSQVHQNHKIWKNMEEENLI
jgi:hypothetical protein